MDQPDLRECVANYYNCLSRLDTLVGDLLAVLQRAGRADHTLVVYLGDHGAEMLRGKRTSYEGACGCRCSCAGSAPTASSGWRTSCRAK